MREKIILIGYMGAGKSTLGKQLSAELGVPYFDLDQAVGQFFGMTISDFLNKKGELAFREAEKMVLERLLLNDKFVLATGGGTPCYYDNMDLMNKNGFTIYLQCPTSVLVDRLLPEKSTRPLISHIEDSKLADFVGNHLLERNPYYQKAQAKVNSHSEEVFADLLALLA